MKLDNVIAVRSNNNNTNIQQSGGTYNKGRVRDNQSATYRRNTETTQRQTTNVMKDNKASSRTTTSTSGNTYRKSTSSQKAAQSKE